MGLKIALVTLVIPSTLIRRIYKTRSNNASKNEPINRPFKRRYKIIKGI